MLLCMQLAKGWFVNICFPEMIMLQTRNVSVTDKTLNKLENHHGSPKFAIFFNDEFNQHADLAVFQSTALPVHFG